MRTVIKYESVDGKLFNSDKDCVDHEIKLAKIKYVMGALNPVPDGCDFSNGSGFVQQDQEVVSRAMIDIIDISGVDVEGIAPSFKVSPFKCRNGIIRRHLDDSGDRAINSAWCRFMCMDDQCREWGQPYFANNPDKGQQVDLTVEAKS